jgi:hypothetical protein
MQWLVAIGRGRSSGRVFVFVLVLVSLPHCHQQEEKRPPTVDSEQRVTLLAV